MEPSPASVLRGIRAVLPLLLCLLGLLPPARCREQDAAQLPGRVVHYRALVASGLAAESERTRFHHFGRIAQTHRSSSFVYIANTSHILRLSLPDLQLQNSVRWTHSLSSENLPRECYKHGVLIAECAANDVFALEATSSGKLVVCGNSLGAAICSLRSGSGLQQNHGSFNVFLKDVDPTSEKVFAMSDTFAFVAGFLKQGRGYPAMLRIHYTSSRRNLCTRTKEEKTGDTRVVHKPAKFISVHLDGQYVYYFFRERYEEALVCDPKQPRTVTRVARMCQSDAGYMGHWLSFTKSRLVCSDPGGGGDPFYFDFLQDTFATPSGIFGLFTAGDNGPKVSAICGFSFGTFNRVFGDRGFLMKRWRQHPDRTPYSTFYSATDRYNRSDCEELRRRRTEVGEHTLEQPLEFVKSRWSEADGGRPLARAHERWLRMTVEQVPSDTEGLSHTVAFVVTEQRSVKKLLLAAGSRCFVEEIRLDGLGEVADARVVGRWLVLAGGDRVVRLPTSRCGRFARRADCLEARDPHCGWSRLLGRCTRVRDAGWSQDIRAPGRVCPGSAAAAATAAVDGGWSPWSSWSSCGRVGGGRCRCRRRSCDWPAPSGGGRDCPGGVAAQLQVANCSVDGAWGSWGAWSPCPVCGPQEAARERSRWCDHPHPQHGGAACGTHDKQTQMQLCPKRLCKDVRLTVNGTWSSWSRWSPCSHACGTGVSHRSRSCARPQAGGNPCVGDSLQWRFCNTRPCPLKTVVALSPWVLQQQQQQWVLFRATCRISESPRLTGSVELQLSITNHTRTCNSSSHDCGLQPAVPTVDGGWGSWSTWSSCDAGCSGRRRRWRFCDSPEPAGGGNTCSGIAQQSRECRSSDCRSSSWGQWNCWSECQDPSGGSGCGSGRQFRQRVCDRSGGGDRGSSSSSSSSWQPALPCSDGESFQERECKLRPCDYFSEWSGWSGCALGVRNRSRRCLLGANSPLARRHCRGRWMDTQTCSLSPTSTAASSSADSWAAAVGGFGGCSRGCVPLFLVGVACLAVGAFVLALTLLAACCWHRRRMQAAAADAACLSRQLQQLRLSSAGNDLGRRCSLASKEAGSSFNGSQATGTLLSNERTLLNNLDACALQKPPANKSLGLGRSSQQHPQYQQHQMLLPDVCDARSFDRIRHLRPTQRRPLPRDADEEEERLEDNEEFEEEEYEDEAEDEEEEEEEQEDEAGAAGMLMRQQRSLPRRPLPLLPPRRNPTAATGPGRARQPQRTVGSLQYPQRTVGGLQHPQRTVGSLQHPQRTVGSLQHPQRTADGLQHPHRTIGSLQHPQRTVGSLNRPAAATAGAEEPQFPPPMPPTLGSWRRRLEAPSSAMDERRQREAPELPPLLPQRQSRRR